MSEVIMRIVSIGDLVTDFYYKNGNSVWVDGGMTSHNIVANISKQKWQTAVLGVCGNDSTGKIAIKSLEDIGVNVQNIEIIPDLKTRCFHVSYIQNGDKLEFQSKKRCPICNQKDWYEESQIEVANILQQIETDDILVFDNLNFKNQQIIDSCQNRKMLDLGQSFEFDSDSEDEIISKMNHKFDIINLNERVEKYLEKRFAIDTIEELYNLISPKLLIVTRGRIGSDFVWNQKKVMKRIETPVMELDPTGAGDAFFSVFITEYIKNQFMIDNQWIDATFKKATRLTSKVVRKFGARGHLHSLYKIKKISDFCTCKNFELISRKKIKRCNLNVNNLQTRTINAIHSTAYDKLKNIPFSSFQNSVFIGTGGSLAGAKFASKVINEQFGICTPSLLPRDFSYRNNKTVDSIFLFTYSGTTNDIYVSVRNVWNIPKYIVTKGEIQKVMMKYPLPKNNILSYRTNTNKGKERGFLSFEGAVAPASLFLRLYFEHNYKNNIDDFIKETNRYWKQYFEDYFKQHKNELQTFLKPKSYMNIFMGDYTESAATDLESKFIESGIFNCIVHEKKNFSHGRFINYENLSERKNIYLKQQRTSEYENILLSYLKENQTLIIESQYNGILCEYDLLIASQYFIYFVSNYLNIDMSKPSYSENVLKIYSYKGEL